MWRKENPYTLLLVLFFGAAVMDNSVAVLKKKIKELPYDSDIPLLGISLKNTKTLIQRNVGTCASMFIPSLFMIAKIQKQSKCPSTYE